MNHRQLNLLAAALVIGCCTALAINTKVIKTGATLSKPSERPQTGARSTQGIQKGTDRVETDWRYTRNGWQLIDVSPQVRKSHSIRVPPCQPLAIHPFQVTMLILLSVFALIAWSTDEWNWSRLVNGNGS